MIRLGLLILQTVWLLFVLPGHTRGLLTLVGTTEAPAAHSCCDADSGEDKSVDGKSDEKPGEPTQEQKERCAVCFFAAAMFGAPAIDIDHVEFGLRSILPVSVPVEAAEQRFIQTYYACGPPAGAFYPSDRPSRTC